MKCRLGLFFFLVLIFIIINPLHTIAENESSFLDTLTEEEKLYIANAEDISVIFSPGKGPIQYVDAKGVKKGISMDVLEKISQYTNLKFNYIQVSGMDNIESMINNGEAQMLSGIPVELTIQDRFHVEFSESYLDCSYGIVTNRNNNLDNIQELTLALTDGLDIPEQFEDVSVIKRYSSIQECMNAIQSKEADFTYGNSYVLEFYSQGYIFQNLSVIPFMDEEQNICFGVSRNADPSLNSILNKAIQYIGRDGMMKIIVKNVATSTQTITLSALISSNPQISIIIAGIVILTIIFIALLLVGNYKHKDKLTRLEHQRYLLVSEVSKEYFYEYDFKADTMTLAEDTAELFESKRIIHKWRSRIRQLGSVINLNPQQMDELYQKNPVNHEPSEHNGNRYLELQLPIKGGDIHWFRITRATIYESGCLAYVVGKIRDVQKEHLELNALMEKSLCDSLTGIYNAAATKEFINQALKKNRQGTLFIIDLDFFKNVNDKFGHQTGDKVIKELSEILKSTFRERDIVGRIGGDEFIAFARDVSDDEFITMKCEKLMARTREIDISEGYYQTISIGVTKVVENSTYELLYQRADAALYFVKGRGRDSFHITN